MTTPVQIEKELEELGKEVERWSELSAWHEGQRDFYRSRLTLAEAEAAMRYTGPATKAKYYAITQTEKERIEFDVANAQLLVCSKRLYALEKLIFTTLGRNKSAATSYYTGH